MFVCRVEGVSHNLSCSPQDAGGRQVLRGWHIAVSRRLRRANDKLHSEFLQSIKDMGDAADVHDIHLSNQRDDHLDYWCEIASFSTWSSEVIRVPLR